MKAIHIEKCFDECASHRGEPCDCPHGARIRLINQLQGAQDLLRSIDMSAFGNMEGADFAEFMYWETVHVEAHNACRAVSKLTMLVKKGYSK